MPQVCWLLKGNRNIPKPGEKSTPRLERAMGEGGGGHAGRGQTHPRQVRNHKP